MASFLELTLRAIKLGWLLESDYTKLAFCLPPTSLSIWDHLIEDIKAAAKEEGNATSIDNKEEEILAFLTRFFSSPLIHRVALNLDVLASSWLGLDYTLRLGKAELACSIVYDIVEDYVCNANSTLHNFFGICDGHIQEKVHEKLDSIIDVERAKYAKGVKKNSGHGIIGYSKDGWQTPKKKSSKHWRNEGEGSCGEGALGGGDAGGGGDGGHDGSGSHAPSMFFNDGVEEVDVRMSSFTTPPKRSKRKRGILAERSALFVSCISAEEWPVYDPQIHASQQGDILLYHGTRTSSLRGFRAQGIYPRLRTNEFSGGPAFYASNSPRQAFEHPLHKHVSTKLDPVSVITFKVSASILHGDVPPTPDDQPFNVMWFPEGDTEWERFCMDNLKAQGIRHKSDIVIGPICLPYPGLTGASPLKIDEAVVTQVAFCSTRSQEWLQKCAVKIFCEKRKEEP